MKYNYNKGDQLYYFKLSGADNIQVTSGSSSLHLRNYMDNLITYSASVTTGTASLATVGVTVALNLCYLHEVATCIGIDVTRPTEKMKTGVTHYE